MATIDERISKNERDIAGVQATQLGNQASGIEHAIFGQGVKYGYFVQAHTDLKTIRISDGTTDGTYPDEDTAHRNPDKLSSNWSKPIDYACVALVGGIGHYSNETFIVLDDTGFPSALYSRIDIVYLAFSSSGQIGVYVMEGTAAITPTAPTLPRGTLEIAQLNIDDTGITSVTDTRSYLTVAGEGFVWGDATGDITDQTDLQAALDTYAAATHNHDAAYAAINKNMRGYFDIATQTLYQTTDGSDPTP
jgi:hypothetical protein